MSFILAGRPWTDPEVTGINRLPARSPLASFPSAEAARQGEAPDSPYRVSLGGTWRFLLCDRPEAAPPGFERPDFDDSAWSPIEVPGNWTRQGWDRPHYTNIQMPFAGSPPEVPEENPTGLYRRVFELPAAFRGRRVIVRFGGAESVLVVWLNGRAIGLSKDSRLPAEFDLTKALAPGENCLVAMVVRWSDSTYIEDQDHWFMAGLHRDVELDCTDHTYIADVRALAGLDADCVDGDVDGDDFLIWQAGFNVDDRGDANGDGFTDGDDFLIWQALFDPANGSGVAVPEPAAVVLLIMLAAGGMLSRFVRIG